MSYTLNQIVKKIKIVAKAHSQINTVHYGSVVDLLGKVKKVRYPALCFMLRNSPISSGKENFPFEFWILDRLNTEIEDHQLEIHSDVLSISSDLVARLSDETSYEWTISKNVDRNLFADDVNTPDATAGLYMELTISQILRLDRCKVPDTFNLRYFTPEFESTFE